MSPAPACCPTCGQRLPSPDPLDKLRQRCAELGIVPIDDHVSEAEAATLLGRSAKTLKNRRLIDRPMTWRRYLGRIQYSLSEVCRFQAENTFAGDE